MVTILQPTAMTRATRPRALALALVAILSIAGCSATRSAPTGPGPTGSAAVPAPSSALTPVVDTPGPIGATETARVVRVVDGDTLIIDRGLGNERLRYIGIDAPESVKPDAPVEFMGKEASAANAAIVEGATLVLEKDVSDTDKYGRLLRYAWRRDGGMWLFVNLELVRQGYAQVATYPPDVRWTDAFRDAQRVARDAGLGLWAAATQQP